MEFELLLLCSKQCCFKQRIQGNQVITIKEQKRVSYIHLALFLCIYTMDTATPEQKPGVELKTSALPEQPRFRRPKSSFYISSHWGHWHCSCCPSLSGVSITSLSFSQLSSSHSVKAEPHIFILLLLCCISYFKYWKIHD